MSVKVQRMPGEPIIVLTMVPPLNPMVDTPMVTKEVIQFKQDIGGHVYRILDFSQAKVNFSDLVMGMAEDTHQEGGAADPDVTSAFIGSGQLLELGVKGFKEQRQYGVGNPTNLFTSLDAALAFMREKIAAK